MDVRLKGVNERLEYFEAEVNRLTAEAANVNRVLDAMEDYEAMAATLTSRLAL